MSSLKFEHRFEDHTCTSHYGNKFYELWRLAILILSFVLDWDFYIILRNTILI